MTPLAKTTLAASLAAAVVAGSAGYMAGAVRHGPSHVPPHAEGGRAGKDNKNMDHAAMARGAAGTSGNPAARAFAEANARMHAAMAVEPSGDVDLDFARGMIPHHEGAVAMARIELEHGTDPRMRKLAQDVVDSQQAEIRLMREWVAGRRPR